MHVMPMAGHWKAALRAVTGQSNHAALEAAHQAASAEKDAALARAEERATVSCDRPTEGSGGSSSSAAAQPEPQPLHYEILPLFTVRGFIRPPYRFGEGKQSYTFQVELRTL